MIELNSEYIKEHTEEYAESKEYELKEGMILSLPPNLANPPFGIIKENRSGKARAKHWLGILQDVGMAGHATVVKARVVKDAGLTPLMWDGTKKVFVEVPEKYLDQLYVLEDGHGRYAAYLLALSKGLKMFDFFFTFKNYDNPELFKKQYISMNKDAQRTSSKEVAGLYVGDSTDQKFIRYMELINSERYIAKAAQVVVFGRELKKADFDKLAKRQEVSVDDELVGLMAECYDAYKKVFSTFLPKILRGTELAFFTKNTILESADKTAAKNAIVEKFSMIKATDLNNLKDAKKDGKRTRGQVVTDILDNILNN